MTAGRAELGEADAACDRLEAAWRRGDRPPLEAFLPPPGPARAVAVRELILTEVECRRAAGDAPRVGDYAARFPDLPAGWLAAAVAAPDPPVAGRFRLLERVGAGASGAVWRAHDTRLDRVVALKLPHPGLAGSPEAVERLRREGRAVAQLRHPGIAPVLDVTEVNGLPALVYEFLPGRSLAAVLAAGRVPPRRAAELIAAVADALHYAHEMGEVHRDVKPANIVLAGDRPVVVDFGLALRGAEAALTADGQLVGTPAYMAPEQAAGRPHAADPRADVYSLGVVLFELLTGRPPFAGPTAAVLAQVLSADPPRPRALDRKVPRDLETVCLKCLGKQPADRYPSAAALADDLRRWARGEAVRVRPPWAWERAYRAARRRPTAAALLAVSGLALAAVAGLGLLWQYNRTLGAAHAAEADQRAAAETFLYFNRLTLASRELERNNVGRVVGLLDECPDRLRGWEWRHLRRECRGYLASLAHDGAKRNEFAAVAVAFSPDAGRLASAGHDGTVRVWDVDGRRMTHPSGVHKYGATAVAYAPDGKALATAGGDGVVTLRDPADGTVLRRWAVPGAVYAVAFSPDGRRLAAGAGAVYWDRDRPDLTFVHVWDTAAGAEVLRLTGHRQRVTAVAWRPGGRELATADGAWDLTPHPAGPGAVRVWDAGTGRLVREATPHAGPVGGLAYSPDGRTLASAGWDGAVVLADGDTGREVGRLAGHPDWVRGLAWSPDGAGLATACSDGGLRLWDPATGALRRVFRGHTQAVGGVAWSGDGRLLATAGADGTLKLWNPADPPRPVVARSAAGPVAAIQLDDVGAITAVAAEPGGPVTALGRRLAGPLVGRVAVRPDGRLVAAPVGPPPGTLALVDPATGRRAADLLVPGHAIEEVTFGPAGLVAAVGRRWPVRFDEPTEPAVRVWRDGAEVPVAPVGEGGFTFRAAVRPDGGELAVALDGRLARWDLRAPAARPRFVTAHDRIVSGLAYSPDGARVATASWDATVAVWGPAGDRQVVLRGHTRHVTAVAWSPDGRRLATAAEDRTVRVWDAATGQEALTLTTAGDLLTAVGWSAGGRRLAAGDRAGVVTVWDAPPNP